MSEGVLLEKTMKKRYALVLAYMACLSVALAAPLGASAAVALVRTETPPKIDGVLDDAVWQAATPWSEFKTAKPDYGKPVSEKTEVFLAYDRERIYVAFNCLDSDPAGIKGLTPEEAFTKLMKAGKAGKAGA